MAKPAMSDRVEIPPLRPKTQAAGQRAAVESDVDFAMQLPVPQVYIPHAVRVHAVEDQVGYIENPDGEHRADGVGAEPFQGGVPVIRRNDQDASTSWAESGVSVRRDRSSGNASGLEDRPRVRPSGWRGEASALR